jgi:hypothetical protein
VEDVVVVSTAANQEPIAADVVLHTATAAIGLGADIATTATNRHGATADAAAANEQEPVLASVVLGVAAAYGLGASAAAAANEQEPIIATVVLRAIALEDIDMADKPTTIGLE